MRNFCVYDSRITYVRHGRNLGVVDNLHFCLGNPRSEFFMWPGAYDQLEPEFLELAVARMRADELLPLVDGRTRGIGEHDSVFANSNGANYVFAEPMANQVCYLEWLQVLDRCEPVNQLIRRRFLDLPYHPVVGADLALLCHLDGHDPSPRLERPRYIRRGIRQRQKMPLKRTTGRNTTLALSGGWRRTQS